VREDKPKLIGIIWKALEYVFNIKKCSSNQGFISKY
jgi:hypothetical protein